MARRLLDKVLDPDALLEKLDDLERQRQARPEDATVPQSTYDHIRGLLTDPGLRAETPRTPDLRAPDDDSRPPATVFLHPHTSLSLFQSAIAYCVETQVEGIDPSEHGIRRWWHELEDRFRRYGPCDIRWLEPVLLKLFTDVTDSRHAFVDSRPATVPLAERATVVIIGDWATGLPSARNSAQAIRALLEALPADRDRHVIHLGDTYYSGTKAEFDHVYLPWWPAAPGSRTGSWSIPGNHDMYSGGHGFFEVLLADPRFARQAGASYFCLGNEHWQFVGLDDSYVDPDTPELAGSQTDWLAALLAPDPRPGTILLTHHQPFSAWEAVKQSAMTRQVAQAVGARRIEAWIWGHEHRAAVYAAGIEYGDYHDLAEYTAIAGHGGVPNLVSGPDVTPPDRAVDRRYLRWENTDYYTVAQDTWSYGGYAVVELDGEAAEIQFYTELGAPRTDRASRPVPPDALTRLP